MSKIGQRRKQNARLQEIRDDRNRREQEWLLYQRREKTLERLRPILIFVWVLLCFLGALVIGDEDALLIWGGMSGFGLMAGYYIYNLWLERQAGGPDGPFSRGGD